MSHPPGALRARRVVLGVISWVVLGLAWWSVLSRDARSWLPDLLVPAVTLVVIPVVTLAWVRHNLGIYQRKGPRRSALRVEAPWSQDSLGRELTFAPDVPDARVVLVELDGAVKAYRSAS